MPTIVPPVARRQRLGEDAVFLDRSPGALKETGRQLDGILRDMLDTAKELARRPPPEGSPIAGVFDPRLPPRFRKLIGKKGGTLRDSIDWKATNADDAILRADFEFFTSSGYGGWVELGTSKMVDRPFMLPAVLEASAEVGF